MARSRGAGRQSQRRKLIWATVLEAIPPLSDDFAVDLLADFRTAMGITQNLPGTTVVRQRLTLQVDLAAALQFDSGVQAGVIVETTGQAAADLPSPTVDTGDDWMYWEFLAAGTSPTVASAALGWAIDIKSQRRIEEINQTIYFRLLPSGTADTMVGVLRGRILLALP